MFSYKDGMKALRNTNPRDSFDKAVVTVARETLTAWKAKTGKDNPTAAHVNDTAFADAEDAVSAKYEALSGYQKKTAAGARLVLWCIAENGHFSFV